MRRTRVATSLLATAAITLGLAGAAIGGNGHGKASFGEPVADPNGVIDLPPGYRYDILARASDTGASDDPAECKGDTVTSTESGKTFAMPTDFDANVLFQGKRGKRYLLNAHELTKPVAGDYQGDAAKCRVEEQTAGDGDSDGWGSVSRLTLGKDGTTVTKRELITTGLHNLCAGGRTPWGTMLVNEEFPFRADAQKTSGWVWEIDPETGKQTRLTGMGRFSHEQEVRSHGAWYLTDDRGTYQYLYKFVPDKQRDLTAGKLYGLKFDRASKTGEWVGPLDPMDPEGDMIAKTGRAPDATNSFQKHEGIVKAKRGNGVVFSESGARKDDLPSPSPDQPGRVWHLTDTGKGVTGKVLVEGDFAKMSHPDNLRYDRAGNLFIFEDNGSALDNNPSTGGNNEAYVLPKGKTGSPNLKKFATVQKGGEGTGPWFSRNGKVLYLSIQDQEQSDGTGSRVLAIHVPKGHGKKKKH